MPVPRSVLADQQVLECVFGYLGMARPPEPACPPIVALAIGDQVTAAPFCHAAQAAGVPEHWRTAVGIALRLMLPMPHYGDYSLDLIVDGDPGRILKIVLTADEEAIVTLAWPDE